MIILSHRGCWKKEDEKNKKNSFNRSFSLNFGTETDIRDYRGKLVISHDIADDDSLLVENFFNLYNNFSNLPLALNIKSDGLQMKLKVLLKKYNIENYFVFDMSVPDTLHYLNHSINFFTRQSEYEKSPSFYENSNGVWLDEFNGHWITQDIIQMHVNNHKKICIVSPDLHKRSYKKEWQHYKDIENQLNIETLMICTDHPEEARSFFNCGCISISL